MNEDVEEYGLGEKREVDFIIVSATQGFFLRDTNSGAERICAEE
jgi:hypothetical protein